MEPKKHKRKKNHVIIITSDDVDANVKQFQVRQWLVQLLIIVVCVIIGAVIGYFLYEGKLPTAGRRHSRRRFPSWRKTRLPWRRSFLS